MKTQWLKQQKPVAHAEKALEYVEKALAALRLRASTNPEHGAYPILLSQVEYVKSVLTKPSTDRTGLHEINLTGGGPRSDMLEEQDPDLYEALVNVSYIAYQIRNGLKIDLQVLEKLGLKNQVQHLEPPRTGRACGLWTCGRCASRTDQRHVQRWRVAHSADLRPHAHSPLLSFIKILNLLPTPQVLHLQLESKEPLRASTNKP